MEIDGKIEALEVELARLKREREEQLRAQRELVQPEYAFVLAPNRQAHEKVADPNCSWYRLEGVVINSSELRAVGATIPAAGGMNYLFNRLSGRFAISGGGGQVYLKLVDGMFGPADTRAFLELEEFVSGCPEGGDVTDIVARGIARREEA